MSNSDGLSRRQFLQATGGAAAAVAIAGCSRSRPPAETNNRDEEIEKTGQTYNRLSSPIATLDPIAATDEASSAVVTQVFDALTNYPDGQTSVEPLLASGYEADETGTTFTFTLREATHHDGEPVTAADVVYSFERLAASPNSQRSSFLLDTLGVRHETKTVTTDGEEKEVYEPGSLAVTAVDERTVRIELIRPFAAALEMLAFTAFAIVPEGIVGDVGEYDGDLSYEEFSTQHPVGCGPFEFVDWQPGTEVKVQRYDEYYGSVPSLAGVHWQIIEETEPYYTYAMGENADTFAMPTAKYDPDKVSIERTTDRGVSLGTYGPVRNGETLRYSRRATLTTYFIGFNMAAVPRPVRRAFAHAVDQAALVENVFKSRGRSAFHFTPPGIYPGGADAYERHAEEYPYGDDASQRDRARSIMEEAGYGPDNPFEVTWTQYNVAVWESIGKIIRDQVAAVHIDMELERTEFSAMTRRGRNGNLQIYTLGYSADYPAPQSFLHLLYPPETITGPDESPISFLDWTAENGSAAAEATEAWEALTENSAPGESAAAARRRAAVAMEESNWADVGFLPLLHPASEAFSYDRVEKAPYGAMGASKQKFNDVRIDGRDA